MSNIVMILLTNGEEVFGELLGENDKGVDLDNVLLAQYIMAQGVPTIIFRKYCTFSNNFDIFFKREHIVATFKDLREEIVQSYSATLNATLNAYKDSDFLSTDGFIEFDPEFTSSDSEFEFEEEQFDDSSYYKNKKRTIH